MGNVVVVGSQWGDEGKAKVIDYLTERSDLIIRFQGGSNAGHTVVVNDQKYVFHMVPSGLIYPEKVCVIGNGVVFDPEQFLAEIDDLESKGILTGGRVWVSDSAHLVMPWHKIQDKASEDSALNGKIGTTHRGIGPTYADKALRINLRVGELRDWDQFLVRLKNNYEAKSRLLKDYYHVEYKDSLAELETKYSALRTRIIPYIKDTSSLLFNESRKGKRLLFEGAQGTFLDIDHGTYPFVTSSNTIAGSACAGSGVGPSAIHHVVGIVKAYTTRVGNGPFPTEIEGAVGDTIRNVGGEFGATTGRARRCGWFDTVMLRKAIEINGITHLALTKLDVLSSLDQIYICTHYVVDGERIDSFPSDPDVIARATPVYETLPGWNTDISQCRNLRDFPKRAVAYVERIQSLCYEMPILLISIGPDRTQTIEVNPI